MGKRNKIEVYRDFLSLLNQKRKGVIPTQLLYKCNLSYEMLQQYIEEMMKLGFVKYKIKNIGAKQHQFYFITQKGIDYLAKINLAMEMLKV